MSIRSSLPVVFCKTGVLRNLAKSPGKHLCQSLFFKKRGSGTVVFSCEFGEIKNIFIYRTPPEDLYYLYLPVLIMYPDFKDHENDEWRKLLKIDQRIAHIVQYFKIAIW